MLHFWIGFFSLGFLVATIAYIFARKRGIMAIVDIIWTGGLGFSALAYFILFDLDSIRSRFVLIIILAWSLRLSFYLLRDRVLRGHEDPRYKSLAEYWGEKAPIRFYFLFLLQILFIALFLIPVLVAMDNPKPFGHLMDIIGLGIAFMSMLGEALADRQLAAFRVQPSNRLGVCRSGLWRYSRHPNYFFEWLYWFAYTLLALGSSLAWLSWIGPLAMYLFLRFVTGVPYAERSSLKSRGEAYRHYQATTNTFFPWTPRKPQN